MIATKAKAQTARSRQNRGHWTRAWRRRQQKWHIADFKVPRPWAHEEVLEVPPDGNCLFHCVVTCRDVARLRASIQDERGFMADRRGEANLQEASRRLRRICIEAAAEAGREVECGASIVGIAILIWGSILHNTTTAPRTLWVRGWAYIKG